MNRTFFDRPTVWMMVVLAALAVLVPMMNIFVPETSLCTLKPTQYHCSANTSVTPFWHCPWI